ncbi:MAG: RagB/SusD family nutrient uptake outer membrane protein [Prevotella sp.]|nr:RagB/SusD family nutrient uptake outer membrane protein [Prevotella sp.]
MKLNKIFISGLAMLSLTTSCSDYLETDPATNAAVPELVFGSEGETRTALYGVYAKICSDELFGNKLYNTFQLNSDVDFYANSNEAASGTQPRRFDVRSDAGDVEKLWNNLYAGIETANEFIYNLNKSSIYKEETKEEGIDNGDGTITTKDVPVVTNLTQMMGEAKVMRAMFYHELLSYFGDVPFTMSATYETDNFVPEVKARQEISDALIADLENAAEYMYSDKESAANAPERISKEAAYAMIARLALQAGGYSLNHDEGNTTNYYMKRPSDYQKYYQTARDYTKRIIDAGGHSLNNRFSQVFIDECNFIVNQGDDPIFEIPFAQTTNGYWGYAQGPTSDVNTGDETNYSNSDWGATNGGVRTSAFYRYSFDESDLRRDYVCGMWYYSNQGLPTLRFDYAMHNNKWSKLWGPKFGKSTTSATGINFAYIRYADVLLMFAEAENELNGPTADAQEALKQVRRRAFDSADRADMVDAYVAEAAASKETFLNAVLDERKWEFAGENMRWKDLVRNNKYAEKVFMTFMTYYAVAENQSGTSSYLDMVEEEDGLAYSSLFPSSVYYCYVQNYNVDGIQDKNCSYFPNTSLPMLYVYNPYKAASKDSKKPAAYFDADDNLYMLKVLSVKDITGSGATGTDWNTANIEWVNSDGSIKNQVLYSLYGYIRVDQRNNIVVVDNGSVNRFNVISTSAKANFSKLPPVRYMLPYPEEAIARSNGVYKNYYGY